MKSFFILAVSFLLICSNTYAQPKLPPPDKSALDISYFPTNYPLLKIQDKLSSPLVARLIYSRPQKNEREIFGQLIEYDKIWRLGANEATEIEFFKPVKINNILLKKGRYTLYAIPEKEKWTIIFNTETDTWGSYRYNKQKDILRVELPVEILYDFTENFTMFFNTEDKGFSLQIYWDNLHISLPISL